MATIKFGGNDPVTGYKSPAEDPPHPSDVDITTPRLTKRPYMRTGRYVGQYLTRKIRNISSPRAM